MPLLREWHPYQVAPRITAVSGKLERVLAFLSVAGSAALLSKRERRVLAVAGELDEAAAIALLSAVVEPVEAIVHVPPDGLVADVGLHHRLFVRVPDGLFDPAFGDRLRRARSIIERFGLHLGGHTPPAAPPGSTPAHAVVFAPRRRRP